MHLFLDESGDLGFDFEHSKASDYFIITMLVCDNQNTANAIKKAAERTLKNKIYGKSKYNHNLELKGAGTPLDIKAYFYRQASATDSWCIYSLILDKRAAMKSLDKPINVHRLYNVLTNHLLKQVNFSTATTINLFIDKSKNRAGINELDTMLQVSLNTILPLNVPLNIVHVCSRKSFGIQAVDLFCWGIFKKYMHQDNNWYDFFKNKIVYEEKFLI